MGQRSGSADRCTHDNIPHTVSGSIVELASLQGREQTSVHHPCVAIPNRVLNMRFSDIESKSQLAGWGIDNPSAMYVALIRQQD